ncbi:MAG: tyrosine-type recombinase/integrase [Pseudohongiellaceae bacterium]|tara:strand:- start:2635 stop:3963 length:1329 start_codon:yes stop_codon:yes gene_type:complete
MPKIAKELSEVSIRRLTHTHNASGEPYKAVHPVGGVSGLYLQCIPPTESKKTGARSWLFRAVIGNKRRWIGLGNYPSVPTKNAREAARGLKEDIKNGIDPVQAKASALAQLKAEQSKELTFKQAAAKYVIKRSQEFKTAKQTQRLRNQLDSYVIPYIGNLLVEEIEVHHLIDMLSNYYTRIPHTAIRIANHCEKIIQQAIISGKRTNQVNPAVWHNNLSLADEFPDHKLIAPPRKQPSLSWKELPNFMTALFDYNKPKGSKPEADCLAFAIHTVSRMGEARLVRWSDIDLETKIWTIKPSAVKGDDKRKSSKTWYIPLSSHAIKLLKAQPSYKTQRGRIFSKLDKEEIPDAYFGSNINAALGFEGVAHGFRATFGGWCQAHGVNDDVSELSLKHVNTDSTREAYKREQLFPQRKKLLTAWSKYAMTGVSLPTANIYAFAKAS